MSLLYRDANGDEHRIAGLNGVSGELVPSVSNYQTGTWETPSSVASNASSYMTITLPKAMPDTDYVVLFNVNGRCFTTNLTKTKTNFTFAAVNTTTAGVLSGTWQAFKLITSDIVSSQQAQVEANTTAIANLQSVTGNATVYKGENVGGGTELDFNTLTEVGKRYTITRASWTTIKNAPPVDQTHYVVWNINQDNSPNYLLQMCSLIHFTRLFMRFNSNGTWQDWQEIATVSSVNLLDNRNRKFTLNNTRSSSAVAGFWWKFQRTPSSSSDEYYQVAGNFSGYRRQIFNVTFISSEGSYNCQIDLFHNNSDIVYLVVYGYSVPKLRQVIEVYYDQTNDCLYFHTTSTWAATILVNIENQTNYDTWKISCVDTSAAYPIGTKGNNMPELSTLTKCTYRVYTDLAYMNFTYTTTTTASILKNAATYWYNAGMFYGVYNSYKAYIKYYNKTGELVFYGTVNWTYSSNGTTTATTATKIAGSGTYVATNNQGTLQFSDTNVGFCEMTLTQ